MEEIDKLNLYRGRPYIINQDIQINVPKLGDICDYGEINYYSMVNSLCSVGLDLCWQLEEIGIKFDEISDFNLFRMIISKLYNLIFYQLVKQIMVVLQLLKIVISK